MSHQFTEYELAVIIGNPHEYPTLYELHLRQKKFEQECADVIQEQYMRGELV